MEMDDKAAGELLASALDRAVKDLELLRAKGPARFEWELRRMRRGRSEERARWRTSGQYMNAVDLERILEAPDWVRGQQCSDWCEFVGLDHEGFVEELAERGLI